MVHGWNDHIGRACNIYIISCSESPHSCQIVIVPRFGSWQHDSLVVRVLAYVGDFLGTLTFKELRTAQDYMTIQYTLLKRVSLNTTECADYLLIRAYINKPMSFKLKFYPGVSQRDSSGIHEMVRVHAYLGNHGTNYNYPNQSWSRPNPYNPGPKMMTFDEKSTLARVCNCFAEDYKREHKLCLGGSCFLVIFNIHMVSQEPLTAMCLSPGA